MISLMTKLKQKEKLLLLFFEWINSEKTKKGERSEEEKTIKLNYKYGKMTNYNIETKIAELMYIQKLY